MFVTALYFSQVPASPRLLLVETADETAVDEATSLNRRHGPNIPAWDPNLSCETNCYQQTTDRKSYRECKESCKSGDADEKPNIE